MADPRPDPEFDNVLAALETLPPSEALFTLGARPGEVRETEALLAWREGLRGAALDFDALVLPPQRLFDGKPVVADIGDAVNFPRVRRHLAAMLVAAAKSLSDAGAEGADRAAAQEFVALCTRVRDGLLRANARAHFIVHDRYVFEVSDVCERQGTDTPAQLWGWADGVGWHTPRERDLLGPTQVWSLGLSPLPWDFPEAGEHTDRATLLARRSQAVRGHPFLVECAVLAACRRSGEPERSRARDILGAVDAGVPWVEAARRLAGLSRSEAAAVARVAYPARLVGSSVASSTTRGARWRGALDADAQRALAYHARRVAPRAQLVWYPPLGDTLREAIAACSHWGSPHEDRRLLIGAVLDGEDPALSRSVMGPIAVCYLADHFVRHALPPRQALEAMCVPFRTLRPDDRPVGRWAVGGWAVDLRDALRAMETWVVEPAARASGLPEAAVWSFLWRGKSGPSVCKTLWAAHKEIPRLEAMLVSHRSVDLSWPALLPPFHCRPVGGAGTTGLFEACGPGEATWRVEALTDPVALVSEGKALQHCVGQYADRCAAGTTHILSVRQRGEGGGWEPHATLEVGVRGDALEHSARAYRDSLYAGQFRGLLNREIRGQQPVDIAARAAARAALESVSLGNSPVPSPAARSRAAGAWREAEGRRTAKGVPGNLAEAGFAAFRGIVPGHNGVGLAEWAALVSRSVLRNAPCSEFREHVPPPTP